MTLSGPTGASWWLWRSAGTGLVEGHTPGLAGLDLADSQLQVVAMWLPLVLACFRKWLETRYLRSMFAQC